MTLGTINRKVLGVFFSSHQAAWWGGRQCGRSGRSQGLGRGAWFDLQVGGEQSDFRSFCTSRRPLKGATSQSSGGYIYITHCSSPRTGLLKLEGAPESPGGFSHVCRTHPQALTQQGWVGPETLYFLRVPTSMQLVQG